MHVRLCAALHWNTAHHVTVAEEPTGRKAPCLHEDQKLSSRDTDSRHLSTCDIGRSLSVAIRDRFYLLKNDPAVTDGPVTSKIIKF